MLLTLIQNCLKQDRVAQKQLYLDHCQRLMNTAYRYATDLDEAKDIVQNSFIRIFNNLHSFDQSGNFYAWTKTICIREAIAVRRKNSNLTFTEDIITLAEKEGIEMEIDDVSHEKLKLLIDALPENHRTILMMYYYDELSHKEISELLDIKESSSRSKLSRARYELTTKWKLANC
ncbi:MAG: RNA polymerase sigma factor [Saprospiraceae bacterium]|nr:RNA polymerase sigma factor [Saprospiraceae bacterium]